MPASPLNVEQSLAEWVLGLLPPENVPDLAVEALQSGCGSSTVPVLAGLQRPTRADVEAEVPQLLRELGVRRPTDLEALKTLIDGCLTAIVAGSVTPDAGVRRIAQLWRSGFDSEHHPVPWLDLATLIDPSDQGGNQGGNAVPDCADPAATLEQSRRLLGRGGLNIRSMIGAGQLDGRVVAGCRVQEHVLDGVRTTVRLGLEFTDGLFLTFGSAPGGAALQLAYRPLNAYDLAEHGRIELRQAGFPCEVLRSGTVLQSVTPLLDPQDANVGVRIDAGDTSVYASVHGENLVIGSRPPGSP